jgi:adenine phosphoribosyltransferase
MDNLHESNEDLKALIRSIPDFPKKGIVFRDLTTLLKDAAGFRASLDRLIDPFRHEMIHSVVGIESRGFILGGAAAREMGAAFVPVRKKGRLPAEVIRETYQLEYGEDAVEIHRDAILPGERVLLVDDLLATGGTMRAAIRLVEKLGGTVVGCAFLMELSFLPGRSALQGYRVHALIDFPTE